MIPMDYAALGAMAVAALIAAATFAKIARYLFDRQLADRNDPMPNLLSLYRKFKDHTRAQTGQVAPLL